jgi:hypothetical protein
MERKKSFDLLPDHNSPDTIFSSRRNKELPQFGTMEVNNPA